MRASVDGLTFTANVVATPFASEIEPAEEKVPSLPTHATLYVTAPPPPELRVNVYVRV